MKDEILIKAKNILACEYELDTTESSTRRKELEEIISSEILSLELEDMLELMFCLEQEKTY